MLWGPEYILMTYDGTGPRRGGPIEFMKIYIDELKNEFKRK